MATSGSQGASRKTNGVLPVSGQQAAADTPKSNKSRAAVEGHKVVIRRLPPGLTEQELWNKLGDEWKAGQGLASWHNFEAGKISQDAAKPSRPARVYLNVLKREDLNTLSNLIQARSWEDAKMTSNSPSLVGPPVLEMASYNKIPSGKKRTDPRQGTIDQDPEFMAFLQDLTNPEQNKETEGSESKDAADESKPDAKVTTTPLIEFLKEKKANKAKEAAAAKSAKQARQESQNTKGKASASTEDSKKGKKDSKTEKSAEKPKETVKILTKKATADAVKAAEAVASQITQSSSAAQEAPKSRRAGIAAAARILQRDLGISPGSAHRRARLDAAKAEAEAKAATPKEPAQPAAEVPAAAASPAPAQSSSNAAQSSERNAAPSAPKSGRTRRGGGGKNAAANEGKGKSNDTGGSSNTPAPTKTPVVLLKKRDEKKNEEKAEKTEKAEKEASSSQPAPAKSNPPTGPKGSGKGSNSKKGASSVTVTPGATRGFVKHANPSQGVTENLLKQAMEAFGTVIFVEIDKRKGFAYVDFSDHDGLAKAIAASPVTVAQGTVQVLERKEKKPAASNPASTNNSGNAVSSSNAPAASSSASGAKKEKDANATNNPDKPEEQRHKRTRRGRGGGKAAANKDAQQQAAAAAAAPAADKAAGAG